MKSIILFFGIYLGILSSTYTQEVSLPESVSETAFVAGQKSGNVSDDSFVRLTTTTEGSEINGNFGFGTENAQFAIKVTSPVSKSGKEVRPLDLSGLSKSSRISLSFNKSFWKGAVSNQDSFYQLLQDNSAGRYEDLSEADQEIADNYIDWGSRVFLSGEVTFSRQDFAYIENGDYSNIIESDKTGWVGSLGLGYFEKNFNTLFKATISMKRSSKGQQSGKFFIPLSFMPGDTIFQEKEFAIGAPQDDNSIIFRLEMAKQINDNFAINPYFNYSVEEEVLAFELPFYFLRAKEKDKLKGLNGGIFLGWRSDESEKIAFGVFLGSNFEKLFD